MFKPKQIKNNILKLNNKIFVKIEKHLASILLLASRLWIANIFFKSGRNKFANMDSTIYLFEYEYVVPYISPVFGAYSSTFFELICPIFLVLGLITRIAVIPLIAMTLVIQMLVIQNVEHYYWLFLLFTILVFGSGKISLDKAFKIN